MKEQLPERFVLIVEGKLWRVRERANIVPNELPHLLAYLIAGGEMDLEVFQAHGLRVSVEVGMDQGEDGPDYLSFPPNR